MLDSETKSRIDTARGILVGKIPNPQAQVEQITIAMIYKFMDDMDRQVEEAGGKRKFFSGTYSRYSWQHLMSPKLGGLEVLNLYSDAIQKMDLNPNIPPLFREIFKNAYLPYKDPETLRSFLKTINGFNYDHSERLGDAFEYLLSILGSQGDAGQFRTPRHIIDFMVYITNPQKGETILDPACGTAGFLISSYKHILKNNSSEYLKKTDHSFSFGSENGESSSGDKLTPDDRRKLPKNIRGFDISPDMVRLSLVNLYLHGFAEPNIFEYDTLTSEDKWNEYYNVILANPPFMSPKGGIRPHKRFSIESNRSEVLFVDYIAEHLTQFGRAAVIVPEGIIFQSGTAYKSLRKMLIEKALYAVVSLPSGVFNPYAGVKTSILLMDKQLAQKTDNILFVKIENDGYDLGAQRRQIDKNDLPQSAIAIKEYKECIATGKNFEIEKYTNLLLASKSKISENGDYNLSGGRYKNNDKSLAVNFKLVRLKDVANYQNGFAFKPEDWHKAGKPIIRIQNLTGTSNKINRTSRSDIPDQYIVQKGDLLISWSATIGFYLWTGEDAFLNQHIFKVNCSSNIEKLFLYYLGCKISEEIRKSVHGNTMQHITKGLFENIKIPLPPLEVQKEIVAEIEGYQKIIDGARQIVDNYKPRITINPNWPLVELGEVCLFKRGPFGGSLKKEIFVKSGFAVYEQSHAIYNNFSDFRYFIDDKKFDEMEGFSVKPGELLMSCSGTMGKVAIIPTNAPKGIINQALLKLTPTKRINGIFLKIWMESENFQKSLMNQTYGAAIKNVASVAILKELKLPLPPLEVQKEIVARIEREQELVNANKELIKIFESKIKSKISSVWGEESE